MMSYELADLFRAHPNMEVGVISTVGKYNPNKSGYKSYLVSKTEAGYHVKMTGGTEPRFYLIVEKPSRQKR